VCTPCDGTRLRKDMACKILSDGKTIKGQVKLTDSENVKLHFSLTIKKNENLQK